MMKVDVAATEAKIREEWAKAAAKPKMQTDFGRLQATGYAVDVHVSTGLWVLSLTEELDETDVLRAAAVLCANFVGNLLSSYEGELGHEALHAFIYALSATLHDHLGYSEEGEAIGSSTDVEVVMKDVGDA